jgi:hypothetical protein
VARIRSLNSFVGSFPVHSLRCGFLGKGGFKVPLPAFEPALSLNFSKNVTRN